MAHGKTGPTTRLRVQGACRRDTWRQDQQRMASQMRPWKLRWTRPGWTELEGAGLGTGEAMEKEHEVYENNIKQPFYHFKNGYELWKRNGFTMVYYMERSTILNVMRTIWKSDINYGTGRVN